MQELMEGEGGGGGGGGSSVSRVKDRTAKPTQAIEHDFL